MTWQPYKIGNPAKLATPFGIFFGENQFFLEYNKYINFHSSVFKTVEKVEERGGGYLKDLPIHKIFIYLKHVDISVKV